NEGLFSDDSKVASVQFHPEASPGPRDSQFVFDAFINIADRKSIGGLSSCR
ncbi:MAG: carbamoyl phosphate synthase small subunit, partial [Sphaerochaetaceae bacterium]